MKKRLVLAIAICVVTIIVLLRWLLPCINSSQKEFCRCARRSVEGKDWLNITLEMTNYSDDGSTIHEQCFVSFDFNKKKPRLFVSFPDLLVYYMISGDCILMIDKKNRDLARFNKRLSLQRTYSVMKNQILGEIQFLSYYFCTMQRNLQIDTRTLNIKQSVDSIVNGESVKYFCGVTPKALLKSKKTGMFTEPLQYQCITWINSNSFHVDSIIAFNITDNNFHDTIKYHIVELSYIDNSKYYDLFFDESNVEYQNYSVHDEKNLPFSMKESSNQSMTESVRAFLLVGLQNDTITLDEVEGWLLLDVWQFGCQPCYEGFERLYRERDSLGYRVLEEEGVRVIAANANSDNMDLIGKVAEKYNAHDLLYAGKGISALISLVNHAFPSYYLISPEKEIVWRSNYLSDYSELLEAKAKYENAIKNK